MTKGKTDNISPHPHFDLTASDVILLFSNLGSYCIIREEVRITRTLGTQYPRVHWYPYAKFRLSRTHTHERLKRTIFVSTEHVRMFGVSHLFKLHVRMFGVSHLFKLQSNT